MLELAAYIAFALHIIGSIPGWVLDD